MTAHGEASEARAARMRPWRTHPETMAARTTDNDGNNEFRAHSKELIDRGHTGEDRKAQRFVGIPREHTVALMDETDT